MKYIIYFMGKYLPKKEKGQRKFGKALIIFADLSLFFLQIFPYINHKLMK